MIISPAYDCCSTEGRRLACEVPAAAGEASPRCGRSTGFTLVEILVTIAIIGILAAIAVPAITNALGRATATAQRMEINSLSQAVEQYFQTYSDYPPDGSSQAVLQRHVRKVFPRITEPDLTLLNRLTDDLVATNTTGTVFSPVAMDRSEALVFFLGGFSSNPQRPFTGAGGPLDYIGPASPTIAQQQDLANYQYNATRENALFEFEPARLTIARATETSPLLSTDETELGIAANPLTGGNDLLPAYRAVSDQPAPIVYFDSRTYGVIGVDGTPRNVYNRFFAASVGGVRPYKTEAVIEPPSGGGMYGTEADAFAAIQFHNPQTYQIISPGSDGVFGAIVSTDPADVGAIPTIHFVTESGRPVQPLDTATAPSGLFFTSPNLGSRGFQDRDWAGFTVNGHLDNVTNFSSSTLESDLE